MNHFITIEFQNIGSMYLNAFNVVLVQFEIRTILVIRIHHSRGYVCVFQSQRVAELVSSHLE